MNQRRKTARQLDGILLLDKPAGITSNRILQKVRHLYGARKAGHTGSLDPFATGMLPLCFGQATKVSGLLLDASKIYRVKARLGVATVSGDLTGEVIGEAALPELCTTSIELVLARFVGSIEQIPPMYSALKHDGRRLYQYAREGVSVARPKRRVTIHKLKLLAVGTHGFDLEVHCSKGTYIRTLVEDIARAMGTLGHAEALRRIAVAPFFKREMVTFERLENLCSEERDRLLLPVDEPLCELPALQLTADQTRDLRHGLPLQLTHAAACGMVRLYDSNHAFVGIGDSQDDGRLCVKRLMAH